MWYPIIFIGSTHTQGVGGDYTMCAHKGAGSLGATTESCLPETILRISKDYILTICKIPLQIARSTTTEALLCFFASKLLLFIDFLNSWHSIWSVWYDSLIMNYLLWRNQRLSLSLIRCEHIICLLTDHWYHTKFFLQMYLFMA